jgi:hypothetical protein
MDDQIMSQPTRDQCVAAADLAMQMLRAAAHRIEEAQALVQNSGLPNSDGVQAVLRTGASKCYEWESGINKAVEDWGE